MLKVHRRLGTDGGLSKIVGGTVPMLLIAPPLLLLSLTIKTLKIITTYAYLCANT